MQINEWLNNNELALNIWSGKYQHNNETFDQWVDRVSGGNETVAKLIREKKFLFGGRILASRGLHKEGRKITYSNCYVLPQPQDNIESIYETAKLLARTFSYGGGVGIDLSKLRPRGAEVNNSALTTTGAVSFMPTYSEVTGTIGQKGRRGALMLSLDVSHPDIEEFIDIKTDLNQVTKANISVKVTDDFMEAVINDRPYLCQFHVEDTGEIITKTVKAKDLFMKLCKNNWDFAEPGILYWDNIKNHNIMSAYSDFEYAGVNPCAEEPLPAGGSCLLGSINLSEFVLNPFTKDAKFDEQEFRKAIEGAVIGLNEVLDEGLPLHPLQVQRDTVRDLRQIGLGVMGIADMLIKMNIGYGTTESIVLCNELASILKDQSLYTSSTLALKDGVFPKYDYIATRNSSYIDTCSKAVKYSIGKNGLRNSQVLTIAPTGSLSTMLGISGGIEPIFNTSYTRKTESLGDGDQYYTVYTPIIKAYMEANNLETEDQIPEHIKITAMNLDPMQRVKMQGTWQSHIDASISSTVNLPHEATVEDVYNIYVEAWKQGLKGITIFRDGCKRLAILTNDTPKKEEPSNDLVTTDLTRGEKKAIAEDTVYYKRPVHIGCGKLNLFIGYSPSENTIQDLYIKKSGNGGCEKNLETTVIGMSLVLRLGGTLDMIEKSFSGISTCSSFTSARSKGREVSKGAYCGNAIVNTIKAFLNNEPVPTEPVHIKEIVPLVVDTMKPKCPECGEAISMVEGCMTCPVCGYSKCN